MRFIIHGAGAVGSLVGGMLAESDAEVILIAREPHASELNQNGLLIKSQKGEKVVKNLHAVLSPSEISPRPDDVIFLTVKTQQTAASVQLLRESFPENTPIFCMQNGVRNEELAARRFLHVYGAMTGLCVNFLEPGVVAHTMSSHIGIGNYPLGCDNFGFQVANQLEKAGFKLTTHESIMAVKWSKLLLNLNNATYTIIGSHLQLGLVTPSISSFAADVIKEGLHILEVSGISLDDLNNPYDIKSHIAELQIVIEDPAKIAEAQNLPEELRSYPSTWMDLKQKRGDTEAGFFNGEVILLGEKHGIPTPYNSTLLQIVETMAAESAGPGRYTLEELLDLVEQRRLKLYHS
ncbi:MAG: 2-dehydropantoate 2-reductase [Acidobacteria bacterium]|nr:2-dehydropantoate 2-reductase [Acidobacteriota bacterium]